MSIDDYSDLINQSATNYGIDPNLLKAHLIIESGGNPLAYNSESKASGIAQFIPATAKSLGVPDPKDPKQAIPGAANLIAQNIKQYGGDTDKAIMAYHGGTDESNWGPKTKKYLGDVKTQMASNDPFAEVRSFQPAQANSGNEDPFADVRNFDPQKAKQEVDESAVKAKDSSPSVAKDIALTVPSAIIKGIGAIPQIPAMAGNAVANSIGYGYGKLVGATDDQQQKLNNLNPFFTGNTPIDALDQAGHAIITGEAGKQNPLTGDVLYNPQTTPGRFTNALVQAGVAGPATGAGMTSSIIGGTGAQAGAELFPGNPAAPLVGGLAGMFVGKGGADAVTPKPVSEDVANVVRGAEDQFGIKVPSNVISGGGNLVEKLAGKADTSDMVAQVNKSAADLIGANDSGGGHTTINEAAFKAAKANNSAAYDRIDSQIGNVSLDNHLAKIADELTQADTPRFNKISSEIYQKMNPDGSISSSDIRELTGYGSKLRQYAKSPNEDISEPAQTIIKTLKAALAEKATPEQLAELQATDNKYKLMSEFQQTARESGAGSNVSPTKIRDVINKAYSSVNDYETPAKYVGNLLNTVAPKKAYISNIDSMAKPSGAGRFLSNAELGASFLMHEPATGIALKYVPMAASKVASKYVNSDWYRNKLLENVAP